MMQHRSSFHQVWASIQSEVTASAVKATPPVASNFWIWLQTRDINWWVAAATLVYVGLQVYVLVRDKIVERSRDE
ncbi:hypothetical protein [Cupriavidus gilardii]|uniref:hypothetical protein n=1 Tax=Cupriavidus gilardii TaxID=82541 RepID=UPI0021B2DA6C|nr:hypothetical protein [Cupriavidus gilardii]UXC34771.1 hypothetical protein N4G38_09990 [Cupriavidus gilardii]